MTYVYVEVLYAVCIPGIRHTPCDVHTCSNYERRTMDYGPRLLVPGTTGTRYNTTQQYEYDHILGVMYIVYMI